MLNLFFDTSALVKVFHEEDGSDTVLELIKLDNVNLWVSELAKLEFTSALYRRLRMNELNENQLKEVLNLFYDEWESFRTEPLGDGVLIEAEKLLKEHVKTIGLRTLDALHLATFQLISRNDWTFIVADNVLYKTAIKLEIEVFNPVGNKATRFIDNS